MTLVLPPSLAGPMEKRQRDDAVYVTGLPDDVNTDKLSELFGSIGVIKVRDGCVEGLSCVHVHVFCCPPEQPQDQLPYDQLVQ